MNDPFSEAYLSPLAIVQHISLGEITEDLDFYRIQTSNSSVVLEVGAGIGRVTMHLWNNGLRTIFAIEPEIEFRSVLVQRMRKLGHSGRLIARQITPSTCPRTVIMPCNLLALVDDNEVQRLLKAALASHATKLVLDVDVAPRMPPLPEIGAPRRRHRSFELHEQSRIDPDSGRLLVTQTLLQGSMTLSKNTFPVYYRPIDTYLSLLKEGDRKIDVYNGFDGSVLDNLGEERVRRVAVTVHALE